VLSILTVIWVNIGESGAVCRRIKKDTGSYDSHDVGDLINPVYE
jgi:hypothetical protein